MRKMQSSRWIGVLLLAVAVSASAQTGSLTGTVDEDGAPLPGVTISLAPLTNPTQTLAGTVTNSAGGYAFTGLAAGDYEVSFQLIGFEPVRKAVNISGQQATWLDIALSFTADSREPGQRVAAPQGIFENWMLPAFGAWNFGDNNLLLYKLEPGKFAYGVAPGTCGAGTVSFDSQGFLDSQVRGYKDGLVELEVQNGIVQSLLVKESGNVVQAEPLVASGFMASSRALPPFTVVPANPPHGMGCTPVYLYSEWVGGCLIDVYGCRPPLQNQVRSIACCFSSVPGEGGPDCEKFLGTSAESAQ